MKLLSKSSKHLLVFDPAPPSRDYLIKSLKRNGYHLTCVTPIEHSPMRSLFDNFICRNYWDIKGVLEELKYLENVDGIICFHQAAINFSNLLAHELNLLPIWQDRSTNIANKTQVNQVWQSAGLLVPKSYTMEQCKKDDQIYPVVVKPSEFQGSIGVRKCNNYYEVIEWCEKLKSMRVEFETGGVTYEMSELYQSDLRPLIQELVVSTQEHKEEYSAEIIVQNGKPKLVGIIEKDTVPLETYFLESKFIFPARIDLTKYTTDIFRYIEALGIKNSHVHFEFKITEKGLVPIELNCRFPGEPMGKILADTLDVDYSKILAQLSIGENVSPPGPAKTWSGFQFIHPPEEWKGQNRIYDGISIRGIGGIDIEFVDLIAPGDNLIFEESMHSHPIGYIQFNTMNDQALETLDEEIANIIKINTILA